jgi:hypothetical protein
MVLGHSETDDNKKESEEISTNAQQNVSAMVP